MTTPNQPEDSSYDMALIEGLQHPRPDIAEMCAWVLGQRRTRLAVPALIEVLRRRLHEIDVLVAAINALGSIGDTRALPALVEVAHQGAVPVRRAALRALAAIDPVRAAPILRDARERDPSRSVRAEAARLLEEEAERDQPDETPV
ncbi:HEAT repeat domain-containing protein [Thermomicrobium sp.]